MKYLRLIFILVLTLFFFENCSKKPTTDETLELTRFEVLAYNVELTESDSLNKSDIKLGIAKEYNYWSKSFQNPQNNLSHISTTASFNEKVKILSGSGSLINLVHPIYFEDNLCHVLSKGFLECKNIKNDSIVFIIDIKNDDIKKYEVVRGGITYFDETIIFTDAYGQIKSINSTDGSIKWEKKISFPIISAPLIYRDYIYFISADNRIFSISLNTGEAEWSFQTIIESKRNIFSSSPVAIENIIIAPFSNGEIIAFKYDDGTPLWSENTAKISIDSNFDIKDITANPVISGSNIYTLSSNGRFSSNNVINGNRNWSVDISGSQTPTINGNQIFLIDNEARLLCLNKNNGEIYWIKELEKYKKGNNSKNLNLWNGPYLINNLLYLISYFGDISIFSPYTGELISDDKLGISNIYLPLIILNNQIFLTDAKANIYRFQ